MEEVLNVTKKFEVCGDVDRLKPGESFEWINSGDEDCTILNCDPPLEKSQYSVKKHNHTPAKVQDHAVVGNYDYDCECDRKKGQPKIIIGTD
jgi:hypothetical protein